MKEKGQSLVEMALLVPLLCFVLIGVFEVGYVLRTYLVLINASREAARYASRPGYIDIHDQNITEEEGYAVARRISETIAGQLNIDFQSNTSMILTAFNIDTGYPCDPELRTEITWPGCDCELMSTDVYTEDNFIQSLRYIYPYSSTQTSIISITDVITKLVVTNNTHNCLILSSKPSGELEPSANRVVVVEIFYTHKQLFRFPIVSNPFTDPIDIHVFTVMRMIDIRHLDYLSEEDE